MLNTRLPQIRRSAVSTIPHGPSGSISTFSGPRKTSPSISGTASEETLSLCSIKIDNGFIFGDQSDKDTPWIVATPVSSVNNETCTANKGIKRKAADISSSAKSPTVPEKKQKQSPLSSSQASIDELKIPPKMTSTTETPSEQTKTSPVQLPQKPIVRRKRALHNPLRPDVRMGHRGTTRAGAAGAGTIQTPRVNDTAPIKAKSAERAPVSKKEPDAAQLEALRKLNTANAAAASSRNKLSILAMDDIRLAPGLKAALVRADTNVKKGRGGAGFKGVPEWRKDNDLEQPDDLRVNPKVRRNYALAQRTSSEKTLSQKTSVTDGAKKLLSIVRKGERTETSQEFMRGVKRRKDDDEDMERARAKKRAREAKIVEREMEKQKEQERLLNALFSEDD